MCVLIAKYYNDYGWIGLKNRDRNYIPEISFKDSSVNGTDIIYFWDNITQYCDGFNSHGTSILSASLMVSDDEKEIQIKRNGPSKDGLRIKKALQEKSLFASLHSLIDQKLTGHTLIFNEHELFLLEGAWRPGEYETQGYDFSYRMIGRNETIVRTNHGVAIQWAGYQHDNPDHPLSRKSSESRMDYAAIAASNSFTPYDLMDHLTIDFSGDGFMNPTRTSTEDMKMRTTSQTLIIPKISTMFVRPTQSKVVYDYWDFNKPDQKLFVELVSNNTYYKNLSGHDIMHGDQIKQIQNEQLLTKIVTMEELVDNVSKCKNNDEKIVMTNGCFDILHAGHVSYLQQAKKLGHKLIVAVNSDQSVKRLKGESRPINNVIDRMIVLGALDCVDWVVEFDQDTPEELYKEILPDVLVKGGDYTVDQIAGADHVINAGGAVEILSFVDGKSTTETIRRINTI